MPNGRSVASLGDLGAEVERAADADADDNRRAMLRAGLQHAVHHVFLDRLQRREAEDLQRRPAAGPQRLRLADDLDIIRVVDQVVADDGHVLALVAALVGQRIGDMLEDRRLDGVDEMIEAVGDRLLDRAVELRRGADLDEIDRHARVRADMAVAALGRVGAFEHHGEDFPGAVVALGVGGALQRVLGVLRYFLQAAFIKLRRYRFHHVVGDCHTGRRFLVVGRRCAPPACSPSTRQCKSV